MKCSDFPCNEEDVKLTLEEYAITHILSISPTEVQPIHIDGFAFHQVQAPTINERDQLLISLPGCVDFIHAAITLGGRVLVHSLSVSRTTIAICAYCTLSPIYYEGDFNNFLYK